MLCLHVCLCIMDLPARRVHWIPWNKLQTIVSCHMGSRNWTRVIVTCVQQSQGVLELSNGLTWEPKNVWFLLKETLFIPLKFVLCAPKHNQHGGDVLPGILFAFLNSHIFLSERWHSGDSMRTFEPGAISQAKQSPVLVAILRELIWISWLHRKVGFSSVCLGIGMGRQEGPWCLLVDQAESLRSRFRETLSPNN